MGDGKRDFFVFYVFRKTRFKVVLHGARHYVFRLFQRMNFFECVELFSLNLQNRFYFQDRSDQRGGGGKSSAFFQIL